MLIIMIGAFSASCGGSKVLKEPQQIEKTQPLVGVKNPEISVDIDWIIVKDGPGSWAKNAYWDEYLFSIHNLLSQPLFISEVAVYDSKGHRILPLSNRKKLVKGSKKTIRRYKEFDIDVTPGSGSGQLLALGGAVTVTAAGVVYTVTSTGGPYVFGSAGMAKAAAVGAGIVIAAPIVGVAAIVQASNNSQVNEEIKHRQTKLPIKVDADTSLKMSLFYPIAPSPSHVIVNYEIADTSHQLRIDTLQELMGLHLNTVSADVKPPQTHRSKIRREGSVTDQPAE